MGLLDLDAIEKIAIGGDGADKVPVTRRFLRQVHAELKRSRKFLEVLN